MEPHNADGGAGGPGKNSIVSNEGCGGSEQPPGSPIVMAKKSSGFVPPPHLDLDNEAPPPPPTADGESAERSRVAAQDPVSDELSYFAQAKQSAIHKHLASRVSGIIGSIPDGWNLRDFVNASSSMSESFSSYSNLGRSLIGTAVGFNDLYGDAVDKEMEWREPWVEIDSSDFRARLAGSPSDRMQSRYFESDSGLKMLVGETVLDKVSAYNLAGRGRSDGTGSEGPSLGTLYLTNFRLLFHCASAQWEVPLGSVASVSDSPGHQSGPKFICTLEITTKTFLHYSIGFTFDISNYKIYHRLVCPPTSAAMQLSKSISIAGMTRHEQESSDLADESLFAFHYNPGVSRHGHIVPGWAKLDLDDEYTRLGLTKNEEYNANDVLGSLAGTSHPWRLTAINEDYKLCPTYPAKFIVPRAIGDEQLERIGSFRSKGRIPAIVYRHPNDATISRCAQPMVGIVRRARCPDDEKYIKQLIPSSEKDVYIIDCRSQAAAYGNLAAGRGFEFSANYGGSKLLFMNIENIHAMRDSCRRLLELGKSAWRSCGDGDPRWWSHLEATRWLEHVRSLLCAASMVARIVAGGHSSLIHCSDGWDRTPQLSALAQILLDPYYRSIRGFAVLVEKEWCAFGHQFATRSGHSHENFFESDECSPIFLQFIDCVFQLVSQFPCSFEFNEQFLIALLDEVYANKTGTFLGDCEGARIDAGVPEKCISAWALLLPPHKHGSWNYRTHNYVNPIYEGFGVAVAKERDGVKKFRVQQTIGADGDIVMHDEQRLNDGKNILVPDCHQSKIKIWNGYYFRQMKEDAEAIDHQGISSSNVRTVSMDSQVRGIFGNTEVLAMQSLRLRREVDKLKNELRKMHELARQEVYDDVEGFINVRGSGTSGTMAKKGFPDLREGWCPNYNV
eukprot:g8057.t1